MANHVKRNQPAPTSPPPIYGVSQAARFLDRSENSIRWLADNNRLESFRDGANRRIFTREALERFQREQAARTAATR